MPRRFIDAWSKTTGQKQPAPVPDDFPDLFEDLVRTPPRKAGQATPADTGRAASKASARSSHKPATPEQPKES